MKRVVEESLVLKEIPVEGYEKVVVINDERSGLKAIICVHNSTLGPTLGGIRIYPYPTFEAALTDVKRLARGMTYKSAMSETGLGGAKSVIICNPKHKTKEMLAAFAEAINRFEGLYTGAEDSGCSVADVNFMAIILPMLSVFPTKKAAAIPLLSLRGEPSGEFKPFYRHWMDRPLWKAKLSLSKV